MYTICPLEDKSESKVSFDTIRPFLDSVIRMHKDVPKYESELVAKIQELSHGTINSLNEMNSESYINKFNIALQKLEIKSVNGDFESYIKKYLVGENKEYLTITQEDGWPYHITSSGLLDANAIKKGSFVQQIGCWGFPSVFNKLRDPENDIASLCDYYASALDKKNKIKEIETGFYVGAIHSNVRGAFLFPDYFDYFKNTVIEQAKILSKKTKEDFSVNFK